MKRLIKESFVLIYGKIWMPRVSAAYRKDLTASDIEDIYSRREDGSEQITSEQITRDMVEDWLSVNSGDFSEMIDFYADLEVGDETVIIPWKDEENEFKYDDITYYVGDIVKVKSGSNTGREGQATRCKQADSFKVYFNDCQVPGHKVIERENLTLVQDLSWFNLMKIKKVRKEK